MARTNQLSKRQREVVELLLQGKSNKQIALQLGITESTVEFHLKNIYAKLQVHSRSEAILKLGKSAGWIDKNLRESVVDGADKKRDNGGKLVVWKRWIWLLHDIVSISKKEIEVKNLLDTKHVPLGVLTALSAGFLWVAWLIYNGYMPLDLEEIRPWLVSLIVILVTIGVSVGLVGKRNGNTLRKVFFSTLLGTGFSPFLIIPLMIMVVLPIGRLAEWSGLIGPATMPGEVATILGMIAMMAIWLIIGLAIGITLLFVTLVKPERMDNHLHATEHGL